MIGLVLKDILNLKKYLRQIVIVAVIMIFFYAQMMNNIFFVYYIITMMLSMLVITTMSYDETAKWDKYALTMPLTRRDIVTSKYFILLGTNLVGLLISLIITVANYFLNGEDILEGSVISLSAFLIFILCFSLVLPFIYKLGVERARLIMILIFFLPTFLIFGTVKLLQKMQIPMPDLTLESFMKVLWVLPVICLIVFAGSYFISLSIYSKKEL